MRLAIVIDVDGDIMYVPEGKVFPNFPKPKLFDNLEDAQEECAKWNTGIIVDFDNNNKTVPIIRSFDDDERQRAKERAKANNVYR
jgi:hypothetical protein|tara:strand:- start:393 stop:647 length:255 start_codon:yes stop_codon:yes gene_type:complete